MGGGLASGSSDETIRVWEEEDEDEEKETYGEVQKHHHEEVEEESWKCCQVLSGHTDTVASLVHHRGRLVSGGWDHEVRVWERPRPKLLPACEDDDDGHWRCVQVLGRESNNVRAHSYSVHALAVDSEAGVLVSAGGDKTIRLWW
jgi:WD40 repeat protein